jgi:phosphoribosylformylglycinamidine synthase subunit PurQ / glutaminase
MRAAVVTFPGSNCDYDCYKAINDVLGETAEFVWHRELQDLGDPDDLIILPGGFSYGDYLRAGAIARFSPIMESVIRLPSAACRSWASATASRSCARPGCSPARWSGTSDLRFLGRDARIRVERTDTLYTRDYEPGQTAHLPLAHGEGNYQADDGDAGAPRGTTRSCSATSTRRGETGGIRQPQRLGNNIAGIINEDGNVLGLMPHPERVVEGILGGDRRPALFESIRDHIHGRRAGCGCGRPGRCAMTQACPAPAVPRTRRTRRSPRPWWRTTGSARRSTSGSGRSSAGTPATPSWASSAPSGASTAATRTPSRCSAASPPRPLGAPGAG